MDRTLEICPTWVGLAGASLACCTEKNSLADELCLCLSDLPGCTQPAGFLANKADALWQGCAKWAWKLIGLHLAGLGLIVTLVVSTLVPVFRIPLSTGLYAVGTQDFYWVDDSRLEKFTSDPNDMRERWCAFGTLPIQPEGPFRSRIGQK